MKCGYLVFIPKKSDKVKAVLPKILAVNSIVFFFFFFCKSVKN